MTAHWIEIYGGELSTKWMPPHQLLGPYQHMRHPLTIEVSAKRFEKCSSHILNAE